MAHSQSTLPPQQLPLFVLEKRCPKCGDLKPRTAYGVDNTRTDGIRRMCRACTNSYMNAWHAAHAPEVCEQRRARYRANPDPIKAAVHASYRRRREYVLAYNRAWYWGNREHVLAQHRIWAEKRRPLLRAYRHARYWSDPERARAAAQARRDAKPDQVRQEKRRYYAEHREQVKVAVRAYNQREPTKKRLWSEWRRARKAAAGGTFTMEDVRTLAAAQAGLCAYCGQPYGRYHIDHKQPLSRGGSNYPENLCLACPRCNLRKHDRTEAEFRRLLAYGV